MMKLHSEPLQQSWLDAYGHLNEAYYLVPFSNASWAYQEHFGFGKAYFDRTGGALYTLETHLRYLDEVRHPAMLEIESMTVARDAKRVHLAHVMSVGGVQCATFECIGIHFDSRAGKTSPLPDDVYRALGEACLDAAERPDWIGRHCSLARR